MLYRSLFVAGVWSAALLAAPRAQDGSREGARELPPAASRPIDFGKEVQPLLAERCSACHAGGKRKGGLSLESREGLLAGGESGPAALAGRSGESLLVQLVAGLDEERVMPRKGERLTAGEIGILRAWIDQGLAWETSATTAAPYRHELRPPELPPASPGREDPLENPIDRLLAPYFAARGVRTPAPVDDRTFARRAFLDVLGVLPSPQELGELASDHGPGRRARLVQRLLADKARYAEHWLSFWNDLLRNDYAGTGYIDGGRRQITTWLYGALYHDLPYDRFVRELVNPPEASRGFIDGIVWRGTVSASQAPPMQAAQNVSQVFLGINLKCASCHDSFVSPWKLSEAYALAGVFSEAPLEINRCDAPTGASSQAAYLYPELGAIDAAATRERRLAQIADILCDERNGRVARTIANRMWARLFGRGLIEPLDEMDGEPWNADLLEWLAADLVEHGWDLKRLLERMLASRAYELPAVDLGERTGQDFVFRGPGVKRMGAEPFVDAVAQLTGAWYDKAAAPISPLEGERERVHRAARWIWDDPQAAQSTGGGRVFLRKELVLAERPAKAMAFATCDNQFELFVNGARVAGSADWKAPIVVDLAPHLAQGANVLAAEAINWPDPETGVGLEYTGPSAAGFFLFVVAEGAPGEEAAASQGGPHGGGPHSGGPAAGGPSGPVLDFCSDKTWLAARKVAPDWKERGASAGGGGDWKPVSEIATADGAPWGLGARFEQFVQGHTPYRSDVRAALVAADRLQIALGRPNREQVVSSRSPTATTLQALELTNGGALTERIAKGAERWLAQGEPTSTAGLVDGIFLHALGRQPSAEERALAVELAGSPATIEGVQDLLWAVVMLPEFQLY